jgi:Transposase IS4
MSQATAKAKAPKKPIQYAKNAQVGDVVHIKGGQVSNHGQLRRWFGSQADSHWFTGTVEEIVHLTVGKTKTTMYDVRYLFPDGSNKLLRKKNIFHHPGAWVNPHPPPKAPILGAGHTRVPASAAARGRRVQAPLFDDTDESSVDSLLEALLARERARVRPPAGLKTDEDSSVDSNHGPVSPPREIDVDERSRNILLDDEISGIMESQLPFDSQGTYVVEEPSIRPVTVPHLVEPAYKSDFHDWFLVDEEDDHETNGPVAEIKWRFVGSDGGFMEPNDDKSDTKRTPLDYFLSTMPPASIKRILRETNAKLLERESNEMGIAEMLRFFGVCILVTRFKFGRRRELWGHTTGSKYIPTANFANTGMSRDRFEEIWSLLTFSHQEPERPYGMSSAAYRWTLVDDFVDDFNRHRRARFRPSETVSAMTSESIANITTSDLY